MSAQPEVAPAAAARPATALAATWQRLRRRAGRTALFMVFMSSAIGVLLTALAGARLGAHLVYSFCVGAACFLITDLVRLAVAAGSDGLRRRRGLAPQPDGPGSGWSGVVPAVLLAVLLGPAIGLSLGDLLTGIRTPSLLSLDSTSTRVTLTISFIAIASWPSSCSAPASGWPDARPGRGRAAPGRREPAAPAAEPARAAHAVQHPGQPARADRRWTRRAPRPCWTT